MTDSSSIFRIIIVFAIVIFGSWLGTGMVTDQIVTIIWVVGLISFSICLFLGSRIYLIIPLLTSSALVLPLPGLFSSGFIAQLAFLAFITPIFLLRRIPMKFKFTELEFWMLILFASVAQAYARNPVGLDIFGSATVGAKPYAVFTIATLCAVMLSTLVINPKDLKLWTYLSMAGSFTNFILGSIAYMIPSFGYYFGATFAADVGGRERSFETAYRVAFVRSLSQHIAIWISSRISPLAACFKSKWLPLVLFSLALAAMSGYRAQLLLVGMTFFVGVCYRGGVPSILASSMLGFIGLLMLILINMAIPLPLNIQRTLTILPGTWDQAVMDESEQSSDWRVEMWIEALTTDKWIRNKILGDGLGFTKDEYNRMLNYNTIEKANAKSNIGMTEQQESFLINGNYHSGPVHTIRTSGYVGLAILLIAMFRLAVHAHRQIKRCRGTEWYATALFLGIPLIVTPIFWVSVIGTFEEAAVGFMMGIAIIRLLEKNLPLPPYVKQRPTPVGLSFQKRQDSNGMPRIPNQSYT